MKLAPADYTRKSLTKALPLVDICRKYITDDLDIALKRAAKAGDISNVECLLLDYDASSDKKSYNGFTALDWALQDGNLPKETLLLLFHMQDCDSAAKNLLKNSPGFQFSDKNSLLAYAVHRKNEADQALLIETFKADIHVAREIAMNTTYEDESSEFQLMKKIIELSAQEMAKAAAEATLRGYRTAYYGLVESGVPGDSVDPTTLAAAVQVSISAAIAKEMLALQVIMEKNVEQRLSEDNQQMGAQYRLFKASSMDLVAGSIRKALPAQQGIMASMVEDCAKQFDKAALSNHSPGA